MRIETFAVEEWMNEHETQAACNIAETCVDSLTLDELVSLDGTATGAFFERLGARRLTYGHIEGSPQFQERVAALYASKPLVLATQGAIGANFLLLYSLIEPGDHVIAVHPTYQQLYDVPRSFGAAVDLLHLRPENGFLPDPAELRALVRPATKLIVLNNPNNPTGALMPHDLLQEIVEIARASGAYILCDEVYRDLLQEGVAAGPSIVDLYEKGISTGSMSKVFSLAGLRLGWIAARKDIIEACQRHRDYTTISCGMLDDDLAVHALHNYGAIMKRNLGIVHANLALLDAWVESEPRISYVRPQAGTTALLKLDVPVCARTFCLGLMERSRTLLTPGDCFDMEGYVRIGYASSRDVLQQGLQHVSEYIGSLARMGV